MNIQIIDGVLGETIISYKDEGKIFQFICINACVDKLKLYNYKRDIEIFISCYSVIYTCLGNLMRVRHDKGQNTF